MQTDPHQLIRDLLVRDYRPFEDSIQLVREKRSGKDAAFAVAFEDRDGVQRRGVLGLCRHHGNTWRPSSGFMVSQHPTRNGDVWITWGGWGSGDTREQEFCGGWAADPTAAKARLADPAGHRLEDDIESGVALFFWTGDFNLRGAHAELLDANDRIIRRGPLYR